MSFLTLGNEGASLPALNDNGYFPMALHDRALLRAKTFHRAEAELIDVLQEIDEHKSFLHFECTSLFDYSLKYLKLSEANASNFIAIARKSKKSAGIKRSHSSAGNYRKQCEKNYAGAYGGKQRSLAKACKKLTETRIRKRGCQNCSAGRNARVGKICIGRSFGRALGIIRKNSEKFTTCARFVKSKKPEIGIDGRGARGTIRILSATK